MTPEELLKKQEGLKPCPFCGNKDINSREVQNSHYVGCGVCRLVYGGVFTGEHAKEQTKRHWNHRPIEDALRKVCQTILETHSEGVSKLQWRTPTDWSIETVDGAYYIEKSGITDRFDAYARNGHLGDFVTAESAKAFCEAHAALEKSKDNK